MGIGIAMTMPTTASTAMGSVSPDKAGIASGVVNASRQVGGALGIAVLGTVGASVASSHWNDVHARGPAGAQPKFAALNGARRRRQSRVIGGIAGPAGAGRGSVESFVHGLNAAMYVGSALTLAAAFVAFFGLKGFGGTARARRSGSGSGQSFGAAGRRGGLNRLRDVGTNTARVPTSPPSRLGSWPPPSFSCTTCSASRRSGRASSSRSMRRSTAVMRSS